jgi:hypothetical protein
VAVDWESAASLSSRDIHNSADGPSRDILLYVYTSRALIDKPLFGGGGGCLCVLHACAICLS